VAAPAAVAAEDVPDGGCADSVPFRSGTQGYHTFRIPAALRIGKRTVLAFAEGRRRSAADDGDIDTVLKRSSDGGCTWGRLQVVAAGRGKTFGNPTPVADPRTGRVVLLLCRGAGDTRQVYVSTSTNGGTSWSRPREITAAVKPANWRWYATGPGHAIALRHGRYAGRLLVPANHTAAVGGEVLYGAHSLYSDDGGTTWHLGYVQRIPGEWINLNESSMAELPDGRVYINARDEGGFSEATRADAYSLDGGRTVRGTFQPQEDIEGPVVQGSVLQVAGGSLLYSGPADPDRRALMTVRASEDGGSTWRTAWTVSRRLAGYSDLVELEGGLVGLLYETGTSSPYESIVFARH
jgi:sialidase-1